MAFQVQGSVLVDGEWVSRTADVYHIMARNQRQEDTEMPEPESKMRSEVPDLGILSRTVIESQFSKFVLPATVRHQDLNDVLLIGEDSVQLKEVCAYGRLRHIATKSDFKGKILAARLFGNPRKVYSKTSGYSPLFDRTSVHRSRRSTTGDDDVSLPPEVIVLTLSSRTLMFLWASHSPTRSVSFRQKTVQLPAGSTTFDRPGHYLAVDPHGRAIAVAAREDCFVLYKTKTMDQWCNETRMGHDDSPIIDEAVMSVKGRIMHMEFLSSGSGEDTSHIVLVFVLVQEGKTKVACYDWDFRSKLNDSSARKNRSLVDSEDRSPSLLIPLSRSPDFLLVYDRHIKLYTGILSGPPKSSRHPIQQSVLDPLRPGESKHSPRWVQWDRVPRNPDFPKEVFYVAREDGRVIYVEVGIENAVEIVGAGSRSYPIDTAFASLHIDNTEFAQSYPDVLVSCGVGSDGHLCKVGAWPTEYSYALAHSNNGLSVVESIPNWSPLSDLSLSKLPGLQLPFERGRAGIFVANGRAPHGEVSELRYGLKAVVDDSFSGMKGCTGVWIVDHGSQHVMYENQETEQQYVTFVVTLAPESIVIRASRTQETSGSQGAFWSTRDNAVWEKVQLSAENEPLQDHIMRDDETIAACLWMDHFAVQITRKEARVLRRPVLNGVASVAFDKPLLAAAASPDVPFVAVAFRDGERPVVELIKILEDGTFGVGNEQKIRHQLRCDPTCLEILRLDGAPIVFVGTVDAGIQLYRVDAAGSLVLLYDMHLESSTVGGLGKVCESAVMLSSRERQQLVCGTRDGCVVSIVLEVTPDILYNSSTQVTKMGPTAARVTASVADPSTAFVACGSDFCRVCCSSRQGSIIEIDSIWFLSAQMPAYNQGPVTAIDQLPLGRDHNSSGIDIGGFMLAVSGDQMVFAQLDYDLRWPSHDESPSNLEKAKVVPRKLSTTDTPSKLFYAEGMQHRIVVSTVVAKEERAPPNGYRATHSALKLLNPHDDRLDVDPEIKQEGQAEPVNTLITGEFSLKHYERVYSLVEWIYDDEQGRKYYFIILGTGITEGHGKESGRKIFLKASSKSGIKLAKQSAYPQGPVRCIAVYDKTHIVSIVGDRLMIQEYDPHEGRWIKRGMKDLPSFGAHLTVSRPFVYVSTTHDSHICYEVTRSVQDDRILDFQLLFTDSRQRSSAHHLTYKIEYLVSPPASSSYPSQRPVARNTLVLLTDKSCSVTGLLHPPARTNRSTTETVFEATLPRSVTRIHRGDIRPPWRRPYRNHVTNEGIHGILADDIIGACTDGTIYSFSIINAHARRILRLIQNLIEAKQKRDPALRFSTTIPHSGHLYSILQNGAEGSQDPRIKARDVDPEFQERGNAAPRSKHIDGDLLIRWLDEDGDLRKLVRDECEKDVTTLFVEKVKYLTTDPSPTVEQAFDWVTAWMAQVLMPLL